MIVKALIQRTLTKAAAVAASIAFRKIDEGVRHLTREASDFDRLTEGCPKFFVVQRAQMRRAEFETVFDQRDCFNWDSLPQPAPAVAKNRIGAAALRLGHQEEAREWLTAALRDCKYDEALIDILSNLAYLDAIEGRQRAAMKSMAKLRQLAPTSFVNLRQHVTIGSVLEDEQLCEAAGNDFVKHFPSCNDSNSDEGREILADPDLAWFRSKPSFARAFPGLSGRPPSGGKCASHGLMAMIVMVGLASPAPAITSSLGRHQVQAASIETSIDPLKITSSLGRVQAAGSDCAPQGD